MKQPRMVWLLISDLDNARFHTTICHYPETILHCVAGFYACAEN